MSPPPWRWQPFSLVGSLQQRSAFQSHFARRYRCHCLERRFGAVKTKCRAIENGNGELPEQFQSFEHLLSLQSPLLIFLAKHIVEIIEFFQAFVSEPEDVESGLVAIDKVCIILRGEKVRVPFCRPLCR